MKNCSIDPKNCKFEAKGQWLIQKNNLFHHNADQKFGMPRNTDEEICLMPNGLLHESYFKVFQEGLSTNDVNRENFFEKLK